MVGLGTRTSAAHAAMLNGAFAHSMDYDDVHQNTGSHAGAPVWAATLAVAEWLGAGAEEATAAFVAGCEVMLRIGLSVTTPLSRTNFHGTGTFGYYGGAAAAGRLLGLSEEAMARALGIAAGQAGGLIQVRGTMSKPFFAGHSAHGGVLSAIMASRGFESATNAIEGTEGVMATYPRSALGEGAFDGLGRQFEVMKTSVKLHACCAVNHGAVDGLIDLRREAAIDPEQIEEVRVGLHAHGVKYVNRPTARTGLAGKFSGQYSSAVALLDGQATEAQYMDVRSSDPALHRLMDRVRLIPTEGLLPAQAEVEVRLKDGRSYSRRVETVKGSPARPLPWDELAGKFERLAGMGLPPPGVAQLLEMTPRWPEVDVRELLSLTVR